MGAYEAIGFAHMRKLIFPVFLVLSLLLSLPLVSAQDEVEEENKGAEVIDQGSLKFEHFYPLILMLILAFAVWRYMVPSALSSLQVAFEIDDGLMEVHRLTSSREDARNLLKLPSVGIGILAYMMAISGVLLLIAELIFDPVVYLELNVWIMFVLILIPVLVSPLITMNAQLQQLGGSGTKKKKPLQALLKRLATLSILLAATGAVFWYSIQLNGMITPIWFIYALLVFMGPTILAYGRIMGASWNMLMLSKMRTILKKETPIDPDPPNFGKQVSSMLLLFFLLTMPIAALNGIITVLYVMLDEPNNAEDILNYGGIIGHSLYTWAIQDGAVQEVLRQWVDVKDMAGFLAIYLSLNVAIVGLAFIFELTGNLFLGGQAFGGIGGVLLASPREIRSEEPSQSKILYFAFAGFSGYTVMLLIMICYKEFSHFMPFTGWMNDKGFGEDVILTGTWLFIAVGQAIFLLTWILSIVRFGSLKRLQFDLNPEQRREGAIMAGGGSSLTEYVDKAAGRDDVDALRRFQRDKFQGVDESIVRLEKLRASMLEKALRGLWPLALEEARKVLAVQGGDDDEARMLMAVGHIACRRLDAAREALHGLEQADGYDEPELISFMIEWMDPWNGNVSEDDIWDWENNPTMDHVKFLNQRFRTWRADDDEMSAHSDRLTSVGDLGTIAILRAQNRSEQAVDIAVELIKRDPLSARARIAAALCLLDIGDWHGARDITAELLDSDTLDPRVQGLALAMGMQNKDIDEMEVRLIEGDSTEGRRWIDAAPCNPTAALLVKGGGDEAVNANVFIAAGEAVKNKVTPRFKASKLWVAFTWLVMMPTWAMCGIFAAEKVGNTAGMALGISVITLHIFAIRFASNSRKDIKFRDQKGMVSYARRLKRNGVKLEPDNVPVANHLLLNGLLLTVNGNVYDIGYPAWMFLRFEVEKDKLVRNRISRAAKKMRKGTKPRTQRLGKGWWLKHERERGRDLPVLEEIIGPPAYRGRAQHIAMKKGGMKGSSNLNKKTTGRRAVAGRDMSTRGVPQNTMRSERAATRRPAQRRQEGNNDGFDFS